MAPTLEGLQWLATRRMAIYVGGLAVIVAARTGPDAMGVSVPEPVETTVVVLALAVMAITYVAERALRDDRNATDGSVALEYTTGQRVAIAFGLFGIAVGGFFAFTDRLVVGVPFVVGAILLLNWAFDGSEGDRDDGGRP